MQQLKKIKFSRNWNNKLYCNAFTTIRKISDYYIHGETYDIELTGKIVKECKLIEIKLINPLECDETLFRLDTGYPKYQACEIFRRMYREVPAEMYRLTLITLNTFPNGKIY